MHWLQAYEPCSGRTATTYCTHAHLVRHWHLLTNRGIITQLYETKDQQQKKCFIQTKGHRQEQILSGMAWHCMMVLHKAEIRWMQKANSKKTKWQLPCLWILSQLDEKVIVYLEHRVQGFSELQSLARILLLRKHFPGNICMHLANDTFKNFNPFPG